MLRKRYFNLIFRWQCPIILILLYPSSTTFSPVVLRQRGLITHTFGNIIDSQKYEPRYLLSAFNWRELANNNSNNKTNTKGKCSM